jgi:hypothetical protein
MAREIHLDKRIQQNLAPNYLSTNKEENEPQ